ncbi:MAG TPA: leucyl aminopeptidase, partial [Gammaproteobacteria bacterium]|nr:leucyl aminopeptidase [Gammaproteobacteria bacterium]
MQYTLTTELPTDAIVDCLVVAIFEQQKMSTMATLINDVSEQKIQHYIDSGDFTGKIGETQLFYNLPGIKSPRVLVVGCGEQGKLTP